MTTRIRLWTSAVILAAGPALYAQSDTPLTFGAPFLDHAVLQRDKPIAVWGTAAAGAPVTITFAGRAATARTDDAGRWTATLPALPSGGPFTLEATAGPNATRSITDVLVGDVFLCSGQSNMEMPVGQSRGGEFAAARSANDRIRLLTIPHLGLPAASRSFDPTAMWQAADAKSVRPFSAACYFMGSEIQESQKVPVGLIHSSWGGTAIEPWIGRSALKAPSFLEPLEQLRQYSQDEDGANQTFGRAWETWWRQHGQGEPWTPGDKGAWSDLPGLKNWKTWGVPELAKLDGMVWYRRSIELTEAQAAQTATLALGGIDEVDETWVNGHIIRNTFGWGTRRTYRLPAGTLRPGTNTLVINVLSTYDAGGLMGPADAMSLTFADGTQVPIGDRWQYRAVPLSVGRPPR
ncbi:MAG: sialate O-acetylesterase, partial [Vicinamibacteria bacterium]